MGAETGPANQSIDENTDPCIADWENEGGGALPPRDVSTDNARIPLKDLTAPGDEKLQKRRPDFTRRVTPDHHMGD